MAHLRESRRKAEESTVTDDLPEALPISEAEVDLLAEHLLDIVTAMIQQS